MRTAISPRLEPLESRALLSAVAAPVPLAPAPPSPVPVELQPAAGGPTQPQPVHGAG